MKYIVISLFFLVPAKAYAEIGLTTKLGISPYFLGEGQDPELSADKAIFSLGTRLRSEKMTGVALDFEMVNAKGIKTSLIWDIIRTANFRFNFFNPGVFVPWDKPILFPESTRSFDFTLGSGVEIKIHRKIFLTVDLNVFFPNPVEVIQRRGDLATVLIDNSFKGSYLCLGFSSPL